MSTKRIILEGNTKALTKADVFLTPLPRDLKEQFYTLLTPGAIEFLVRLITRFEDDMIAYISNDLIENTNYNVQSSCHGFQSFQMLREQNGK